MPGHAAPRASRLDDDAIANRTLVDDLYASFRSCCVHARQHLEATDPSRFEASTTCATQLTCVLRECLDYARTPVLCAYLNATFDYVIGQLEIGRSTRDLVAIEHAANVMAELEAAFGAAHRRAVP